MLRRKHGKGSDTDFSSSEQKEKEREVLLLSFWLGQCGGEFLGASVPIRGRHRNPSTMYKSDKSRT